MVQKGKVEETVLESVPQLVIQLVNGYLLGQPLQGIAIFSIALSVLSLSSTVWYYAYWCLFRCKPIRDAPSSLSLYNYKLSGVKEGMFSFAKPIHGVHIMDDDEMSKTWLKEMTSVSVADTEINDSSTTEGDDSGNQIDTLLIESHAIGGPNIQIARKARANQDSDSDKLREAEEEMKAVNKTLQDLEAEKLRMAQELQQLSTLLQNSASTAASGGVSGHGNSPLDTVQLAMCRSCLLLTFFEQAVCFSETVVCEAWAFGAPANSISLHAYRLYSCVRGQQ